MIPKQAFGRTGHESTRVVFGGWALRDATQAQADRVLKRLLEHGVNHLDTAPMYGNAEKRIGSWMEKHRDDFFLATKTRKRTYEEAKVGIQRSLERLHVDRVDLLQIHGLTNEAGWERTMGPGGALEALVEAREDGLVRFLGVTGHGIRAAAMHARSLERFDFDSVMLPFNYPLMRNRQYAADFRALVARCRERDVAVQTMKAIARVPCRGGSKRYNTFFYEPLETQAAIDQAVHWGLGRRDVFLVTAGDMRLLPKVLDAAARFKARPSEAEMKALVDEFGMRPVFS